MIEAIIEVDDAATERYFEGQMPTEEEISQLTVEAVAAGSLIPVLSVSAKTGVGLAELLDALAGCGLPPDKLLRTAKNDAGQEQTVKPDPAGPLVAQIFKTRIDPFVHKLTFVRIFAGTVKKDDTVHVSGLASRSNCTSCSTCKATKPTPSNVPRPAISWPWPRPTNCTRDFRSAS